MIYLSVATNLADGHGFLGADQGLYLLRPGFTLFLAGVISLFGNSAEVYAWAILLVASLLIVFIYAVGTRLYDWRVGLFGAVFFLTTPGIIEHAPKNLDPLWPMVLFAALLLLLLRNNKHDVWIGCAGGLLASYAFFVKEVSILFVLLPVLLAAFKLLPGRRRRWAFFYIIWLLPIFSWGVYRFLLAAPPENAGGTFESSTLRQYSSLAMQVFFSNPETGPGNPETNSIAHLFIYFIKGVWLYFTPRNPAPPSWPFVVFNQPLGLLLIPAFLWACWRAIKGIAPDRILIILFVLFLPVCAVEANENFRYTQNLLVIGLFNLFLAAGIMKIIDYLTALAANRTRYHAIFRIAAPVTLGSLLIVFQFYDSKPLLKNYRSTSWLWNTLNGNPMQLLHQGEDLGHWLAPRITRDEAIIVADLRPSSKTVLMNAINWMCSGNVSFSRLPLRRIVESGEQNRELYRKAVFVAAYPVPREQWENMDIVELDRKIQLSFLDLDSISQASSDHKVRYIAVFAQWAELIRMLSNHPGFKHETTINDYAGPYFIFSVLENDDRARQTGETPEVTFDRRSAQYLNWLNTNYPKRYETYKALLLSRYPAFQKISLVTVLKEAVKSDHNDNPFLKKKYKLQTDSSGEFIVSTGNKSVIRLVPNITRGVVGTATLNDGFMKLGGWAVDIKNSGLPEAVLVFIDGELAFSGQVELFRPDVAQFFDIAGFANSGFNFKIPVNPTEDIANSEVRMFAVSKDNLATELYYSKNYPWPRKK